MLILATLVLGIGMKMNQLGGASPGGGGGATSVLQFDYSTTAQSQALFL